MGGGRMTNAYHLFKIREGDRGGGSILVFHFGFPFWFSIFKQFLTLSC